VERFVRLAAGGVVISLLLILGFIVIEALPAVLPGGVGLRSLFQGVLWRPTSEPARWSLLPMLVGTLKIAFIALAVGLPIGVSAAVYASEFAPPAVRETLKPVVEFLAGVPSVVIGFLALVYVASGVQGTLGGIYRLNALVAGLAVGVANLPLIFSVSEDALRAVAADIREAAIALGATEAQAVARVVLPAALPGLAGAAILALGRAIGETMIVLMVAGNAALLSLSPLIPTRTLSATIGVEMPETQFGGMHYHVLFFIALTLMLVTLAFNLLAGWMAEKGGAGR
jgi:phosphate transport system permease protein